VLTRTQPALPSALFDEADLQAGISEGNTIAAGKACLQRATEYLHQQFRSGTPASRLIRLRASFMDALLCRLWEQQDWGDAEASLVAVGGYGRGELHFSPCYGTSGWISATACAPWKNAGTTRQPISRY
jgi:hypothetical protein